MKKEIPKNKVNRPGIVLLVTLVVLIVLSTLAFTLSSRVAAQRHRDWYMIRYQKARYACDSALKYALATLDEFTPQLVSRPNEPDFSDLFILTEQQYQELLAAWADELRADRIRSGNDVNDSSYAGEADDVGSVDDFNDPNSLTIRGPYGPSWPFVTEPVEFEIGDATVKIEIEDENAKYPIGWALLGEKQVQREAQAGLEIFCEWMGFDDTQIESLKKQLKQISEIKLFKLDFKPTTITDKKRPVRVRRRGRPASKTRRDIPAVVHIADFARLFHSSLIDTEALARPTIISESRKESALKYMGLWASSRVNINTAPRHVLEAAFAFGGDEVEIAEEIIQRRRISPFKDIQDLKKALFRYSASTEKCEKYITTASRFFTIKVTAVSGVAKASTIIAITKDGKKIERIAVISS